jgi:hypothetical protein
MSDRIGEIMLYAIRRQLHQYKTRRSLMRISREIIEDPFFTSFCPHCDHTFLSFKAKQIHIGRNHPQNFVGKSDYMMRKFGIVS